MRLLNRLSTLSTDAIALGASAVIIATFSTLLYADLSARLDAGDAVQIGTITYKKRVAQRKYGAQVIWEDVEQNVPVFNNDSVRTSDSSEAVIRLADGTDIQLEDNSMILLSMAEGAININFEHGSIFARRGDVAAKDIQQVKIVSKDANVSIEKSDVKLTKDENKDLNLTVTKGTAKIETGSEVKTIKEDQRVVVSQGAKEAKVYDIRLRLAAPEANRFFVTQQANQPISFSWEPVSGATEVFFEIAPDSAVSRPVVSRRVDGTTAAAVLGAGSHYWRLRAKNAGGGVEYSETRKLTIVQDRPVRLTTPMNGAQFAFVARAPIIGFRWESNALATGYTVEVAADAAFTRIVRSVPANLTEIAVDSLGEGVYFWRVRTSVEIAAGGYAGSSTVHQFTVSRKKALEPPVLIAPAGDRVISAGVVKSAGLMFSWRPDPQIRSYRLSIARDQGFSQGVITISNNGNFYELDRPLPEGQYYWRVQGVGAPGEEPVLSAVRRFTVSSPESIRALAPATGAVITVKSAEKTVPVAFSWKPAGMAGRYQFELARDRDFAVLHTRQLVSGTGVTVPLGEAGAYFWRVRLIDDSRAEVMSSDTLPLSVNRLEPEKPKAVLVVIAPAAAKGAAISIDGKLMGHDMVRVEPKPGVAVRVEIAAKEFEPYQKSVTLADGQTLELRAEMAGVKKKERAAPIADMAAPIVATPVTAAGGILIVGSNDGRVSGFRKDGSRAWNTNLQKRFESAPAVQQSQVFVVTVDGTLYCINAQSGAVVWSRKAAGTMLFGSKPLVVGDRVYLATGQGVVQAFSTSGAELWQKRLDGGIYCSPAHHDGVVYVGTNNYRLHALKASNGAELWAYELDGRIVAMPVVADGALYVGSFAGSVYSLTAKKGALNWKFPAGDAILAPPTPYRGTVYAGTSAGTVFAIAADNGKERWRYRSGGKIQAEAVALRDTVYVPAGRTIFALTAATGALEWKRDFDHAVTTSAAAVGDELFFGLDNGRVVSVRTDLGTRVR